jgi:RND family efflux transporter MFP subunit
MRRVLSIAALLTLAACGVERHPRAPAAKSAPVRVQVEDVRQVSHALSDEVVGTVRARQVATVSASVMGTIRALNVRLGSRVRAGDVLVQLAVGEIDAKAAQARATFAQAGLEMKRAEQLKASQSIPPAQYDAAVSHYRLAEAALAEAEAMRAYTVIRAPFAGVVTDKPASIGDLALPGKTLLTLESPGALRLEAHVPEGIASALHLGDVLQVRFDALEAALPGKLSELSPSADAASRSVLVKLDLPPLPELRAGMFGRVAVPTGEESTIVVPERAIRRHGQLEFVFVVDSGSAHLRLIRSGRARAEGVEVLSGMDGAERVAVTNLVSLEDQQPVEVIP